MILAEHGGVQPDALPVGRARARVCVCVRQNMAVFNQMRCPSDALRLVYITPEKVRERGRGETGRRRK